MKHTYNYTSKDGKSNSRTTIAGLDSGSYRVVHAWCQFGQTQQQGAGRTHVATERSQARKTQN
jgi:hypothetical protein